MVPNASSSHISAERLDLLVDGSLPDRERRALLLALDTEPGGWRRCALAFLEAQTWRMAIETMADLTSSENSTKGPAVLLRRRARIAPIALAAAIMLAAFVIGRATGPTPGPVSDLQPPSPIVATGPDTLGELAVPFAIPEEARSAPAGQYASTNPMVSPIDPAGYQEVGVLKFASDDDPDGPFVQVPVLAGPGIDDRWLRDQPSFIPEEVRQSWERGGFDVEEQRRLVSVQIDESGRYLTIPVDEVLLRQPTRATY